MAILRRNIMMNMLGDVCSVSRLDWDSFRSDEHTALVVMLRKDSSVVLGSEILFTTKAAQSVLNVLLNVRCTVPRCVARLLDVC